MMGERDPQKQCGAGGSFSQHHVVGDSFPQTQRRDQGEDRFLIKLLERERGAVAHSASEFSGSDGEVVLDFTGIGNEGIDSFFKAQVLYLVAAIAIQIVALPVPGPVGSFAPVLLVKV